MVTLDVVRNWLADHGYRDLYPYRDAIDPSVTFYSFVKDGRRKIGVRFENRFVSREVFDTIKRTVLNDESGH